MGIDFEEDSKRLPSNAEIQDVSKLVNLMLEKQRKVTAAKIALKQAEDELARIAQKELPEAMQIAGTQDFTTTNGIRIVLKEDLFASISEANRDQAFTWLQENGFGDLIKNKVDLSFGRGEENRVQYLLKNLEELGYNDYSVKESIHGGTLKAFLKEQLAAGTDVPLELFGAFQFKEAVIK
jgi:hypothetical protein